MPLFENCWPSRLYGSNEFQCNYLMQSLIFLLLHKVVQMQYPLLSWCYIKQSKGTWFRAWPRFCQTCPLRRHPVKRNDCFRVPQLKDDFMISMCFDTCQHERHSFSNLFFSNNCLWIISRPSLQTKISVQIHLCSLLIFTFDNFQDLPGQSLITENSEGEKVAIHR